MPGKSKVEISQNCVAFSEYMNFKTIFVIVKISFWEIYLMGLNVGDFSSCFDFYLWGMRFHAVVVFGMGKVLLFKYVLGRCEKGPDL